MPRKKTAVRAQVCDHILWGSARDSSVIRVSRFDLTHRVGHILMGTCGERKPKSRRQSSP